MIEILQLEDWDSQKIDIEKLDPKHTFDGLTYLHFACVNQNALPLVKELICRGDKLTAKDKFGSPSSIGATPIFFAAVNPNPATLKYILEDDSQYLRVYDNKNNTPLISAIIAKRSEVIHYILQKVPTSIKDKAILRMTPLSVACRNGFMDTIRTVMSYKGSAPNQPGGWEKMTPLCYSSAYGYYQIVEFLLSMTKAKIDKADKFGRTPLMLACRNGHVKIASLLIRYGADIKTEDTSGNSALHYASAYGFPECIQLLLNHGANINAQNLWNSTPLAIAMLKRNLICVDCLLQKADNINADIKDDDGNTLLSIAIESMSEGNMKLVEKLLENSNPDIQDAQGNTPLIKVIQRITKKRKDSKKNKAKVNFDLEVKVAKQLLEKGADSSIKNKAGHGAIDLIMETGSYSRTNSKSDSISDLIQLLWKGFSFVKNPNSFFTFNKNILSLDTQEMILSFIDKSVKELEKEEKNAKEMLDDEEEEIIGMEVEDGQLPDRVINTLDAEGYTPLLRYIKEFTDQGKVIYNQIEQQVVARNITKKEDLHQIDLVKIMENKKAQNVVNNAPGILANNNAGFGNNAGGGLFGNNAGFGQFGNNAGFGQLGNNAGFGQFRNNAGGGIFGNNNAVQQPIAGRDLETKKLALELFDDKIAQPFTEFLRSLIEYGANKHATVDKLKDYREEVDGSGLKFKRRDSFGKIKTEYCYEGLSNSLHLILDFPSKSLFDFILDSGVTTEEINIQKMTPFFTLIKMKDTSLPEYKHCLDKLLNTKADIDSPDQFGISAFWYCYQNQKIDLAFYLASKGADVNNLDNYGFFALKKEIFENNLERIKKLLSVGADINKPDEFKRTVLHHAFNRYRIGNDVCIIRYLMANGADINARDFKNRSPLHYLFVKSNRRFKVDMIDPTDVIAECVNCYQNISFNDQDNNGNTVLHYICQRNSIKCLALLKH